MRSATVICLSVLLLSTPAVAEISSWAYQLQGYDKTDLEAISVDLLVVDVDELQRSKTTLDALKRNNKHVVSYLSVGEAESYRGYWQAHWKQRPPAWLDRENPNWAENYRVRYWTRDWRAIMTAAITRIAKAGFDGVYLDTVDTYEFYREQGHEHAAEAMVRLVVELSEAGRAINPGFMVIAQNGAELAADSDYRDVLDGIASEDTFYDGDHRKRRAEIRWTLDQLRRVKDDGKFVLSVDYPTRFGAVLDYCRRAADADMVPLVAPRALDGTLSHPDHACVTPGGAVAAR